MDVNSVAVFLIILSNFCDCQQKRYDDYSLYQVLPMRLQHLTFLQNLDKRKYLDVQFWVKPARLYRAIQFIANNNETQDLMERMNHFGLPFEVLSENVQKEFDEQTPTSQRLLQPFTWDSYQSLEDIYRWIHDIAVQYPSTVKLELVGRSAEDRNIFAVAIKKKNGIEKPTVIIEAGIHGHEWISPMFAAYLINNLIHIDKSHDDSRLSELADAYDWYIIPVANPDGFKYSHTEDRLWRKNRRTISQNHTGVDLNKNFNYSFGLHGASLDPADDSYCGPAPFSEPETRALANFITSKGNDLVFYFSIHSYGQMIILPCSDEIKRAEDFRAMENFAKQAIIKMYRFSGNKYSVGTNYDTLGHRGSGDSVSWVKKNIQPRFAATFVLRDYGRKGHALPPGEILPTCRESILGLIEMMTAKPKLLRTNIFHRRCSNAPKFRLNFVLVTVLILLNL